MLTIFRLIKVDGKSFPKAVKLFMTYTPEKLSLLVNVTQNNDNDEHPSLRLIGLTNYSKKHAIVYYVDEKPFNLHQVTRTC